MCDTYMRVNENVRQVRQQWGFTCFFTLSFRFLESICIYVGKNTASVKKKGNRKDWHESRQRKDDYFLIASGFEVPLQGEKQSGFSSEQNTIDSCLN